jgi:hypothetical protein
MSEGEPNENLIIANKIDVSAAASTETHQHPSAALGLAASTVHQLSALNYLDKTSRFSLDSPTEVYSMCPAALSIGYYGRPIKEGLPRAAFLETLKSSTALCADF